jgi:hypothetical protein
MVCSQITLSLLLTQMSVVQITSISAALMVLTWE